MRHFSNRRFSAFIGAAFPRGTRSRQELLQKPREIVSVDLESGEAMRMVQGREPDSRSARD